jgi:hypothetical protein
VTWTPRKRPPAHPNRELVPIRISKTAIIVIVWNQFLIGGLLVLKWMDSLGTLGCPDWNPQCVPPPSFYWWKVIVSWIAGNIVLVMVLAAWRLRRNRLGSGSQRANPSPGP